MLVATACVLLAVARKTLFQNSSTVLRAVFAGFCTHLTAQCKAQPQPQRLQPAAAATTPRLGTTAEEFALALIQSRRSIFPKHMTGDAVSQKSIMKMLEAANWAPTHGRTEPWRFVVLGQHGMADMQLLTEVIFRQHLASQPAEQQVCYVAVVGVSDAQPRLAQPCSVLPGLSSVGVKRRHDRLLRFPAAFTSAPPLLPAAPPPPSASWPSSSTTALTAGSGCPT